MTRWTRRAWRRDEMEEATADFDKARDLYFDLVAKPRSGNVLIQLRQWRQVADSFFAYGKLQAEIIQTQRTTIRELTAHAQDASNSGKPWEEGEDELLVQLKCKGDLNADIARDMGRTEGAVSTRLSYLVGIRRLQVNIYGEFAGVVDGRQVAGSRIEGVLVRV